MRLTSLTVLLAAVMAAPSCIIETGGDGTFQCEGMAARFADETAQMAAGCVTDADCMLVGGPERPTCELAGGIAGHGVAVRRSLYIGSSTQAVAARFEAAGCEPSRTWDAGDIWAVCEQNTCQIDSANSCFPSDPDGGIDAPIPVDASYPDAVVSEVPDAARAPDAGI